MVLLYLLVLFALTVVLRHYVYETYRVSVLSMKTTLLDGDKLFVSKLSQSTIARNDILVFEISNESFVTRCIALPGDTIQIVQGNISINNKKLATFTTGNTPELQGKSHHNNFNVGIFDYYRQRAWTKNNFGPYLIPEKGKSVLLNADNIGIYERIIKAENNIAPGSPIDDRMGKAYTFKKNYYFMLGDNRNFSSDSREFGPVPAECFIGKATLILFSERSLFNTNRIFKKVQ
jgi:signal peptidase I